MNPAVGGKFHGDAGHVLAGSGHAGRCVQKNGKNGERSEPHRFWRLSYNLHPAGGRPAAPTHRRYSWGFRMRGQRRRTVLLATAGVAAALAVGMAPLLMQAQTPAQPAAYRAPRTADGKPNLTGIWQAMNTANWDIQA